MFYSWCELWCEWFILCWFGGESCDDELIIDFELAVVVELYGEVNICEVEVKWEKKVVVDLICGVRGIVCGWWVLMMNLKGIKYVFDFDCIVVDYEWGGL